MTRVKGQFIYSRSHADELRFCIVQPQLVRGHPGPKGSHDESHDVRGRNSVGGRAVRTSRPEYRQHIAGLKQSKRHEE